MAIIGTRLTMKLFHQVGEELELPTPLSPLQQ